MPLGHEWHDRGIFCLIAERVPEIELPVEAIAVSRSIAWNLPRAKSMMPAMECIRESVQYAIKSAQDGAVVSDFPAAQGD